MRDIQNGDAPRAQFLDDPDQALRFGQSERGRRLVHDQNLGLQRERFCDLHHLLLGERQLAQRRPAGNAEAELVKIRLGVLLHFCLVKQPQRPAESRLPA